MPKKAYSQPVGATGAATGPLPSAPAAKPPAPPALNPKLAALITEVEKTRFDPTNPPPKEPCIFKLAGNEIAHPGNIVTLVAAVKSGKSSAKVAMLASLFGSASGDYLGFEGHNPEGKWVFHFDTEQSRGDHHEMMMIGLRRAGIEKPPTWFASYSLVRLDPAERRAVIMAMARRAADDGGLLALFIDGVADLVQDVNEPEEANGLVGALHQFASDTACVVVVALHHNPGSEKSRGHLGSQLERKSESVLVLRKADGVISITCQPARHAEVSGDKAPCFTWSTEAGMHISTKSKAASKDDRKRTDLIELADEVFATKSPLRWTEMRAGIMKVRACVESTASEVISDLRRLGVISRDAFGSYSVKRP